MYFISPFDLWVLSVQKIEFFCIPQSYLTVVEYSTSFARQKPQIIVCWIDYRFVFSPRLLLCFLFTSYCICMRFLVVMKIVINLHLKMNCDHVSLLLGFVTTIFYFWVLYFFLFVCSRSTKDEIFCCSSCLVRFKFFAQIYYIILQLLLLIYSSSLTFLYIDNTFAIFFFFVLDCS